MQVTQYRKDKLRKLYNSKRKSLDRKRKEILDSEIFKNLISLNEVKNSDTVLCYISLPDEVDTHRIVSFFINGKAVYAPVCRDSGCEMNFYRIDSMSGLFPGKYGILEPRKTSSFIAGNNNDCICIIPGLCFDKSGRRLGYGKGYYDRFLKDFKGVKIGLCYLDFLAESVPNEENDIPVDIIVTDKNVLYIKEG